MQTFTLATLETDAGPMPAIRISGRFWRLSELDPRLAAPVKQLLQDWPASFPRLANAAEQAVAAGGPPSVTAPRLLTPVLSHFLRPPTTTLVGPGKTVWIPDTTRQFRPRGCGLYCALILSSQLSTPPCSSECLAPSLDAEQIS